MARCRCATGRGDERWLEHVSRLGGIIARILQGAMYYVLYGQYVIIYYFAMLIFRTSVM